MVITVVDGNQVNIPEPAVIDGFECVLNLIGLVSAHLVVLEIVQQYRPYSKPKQVD